MTSYHDRQCASPCLPIGCDLPGRPSPPSRHLSFRSGRTRFTRCDTLTLVLQFTLKTCTRYKALQAKGWHVVTARASHVYEWCDLRGVPVHQYFTYHFDPYRGEQFALSPSEIYTRSVTAWGELAPNGHFWSKWRSRLCKSFLLLSATFL